MGAREDQRGHDAKVGFTEDLWTQVQRRASRSGITPADFVREAVRRAVVGDESLEQLAARVRAAVADQSHEFRREGERALSTLARLVSEERRNGSRALQAEGERTLRQRRDLRAAREMLLEQVAAGGEAVYTASPDWRRIRALTGSPAHDATMTLEAWLQDIVHPADERRVATAIEAARRDLSPLELEHRSVQADRTVRLRAVPLEAGEGRVSEWLVALRHH